MLQWWNQTVKHMVLHSIPCFYQSTCPKNILTVWPFLFSVGEQDGVKEATCEWSAMAKTLVGSPAMLFIPLCEKNQTFPNKDLWSLTIVSESVHLVSGFAVHFKVCFIRFFFTQPLPLCKLACVFFTAYPGVFETTSQDFCSHNRLLMRQGHVLKCCVWLSCSVLLLCSVAETLYNQCISCINSAHKRLKKLKMLNKNKIMNVKMLS